MLYMLYKCSIFAGKKASMKANESLQLSLRFKDMLASDLSHAFAAYIPSGMIEEKASSLKPKSRNCVFTPANVILTMLLTAIQEDKSLQSGLNLFKTVFESNSHLIFQEEAYQLNAEKIKDSQLPVKAGRPKTYKSRLSRSCRNPLSENTAGYSTARKNLDTSIFEDVFKYSADFGDLDKERWHGMKTYVSDGTYLQLQGTEDIKSQFAVKNQEDSYPQALLQVLIRQGTGQVSQFTLGSRDVSELFSVIPMIRNMEENSLLLADDLYNSWYHFCLVLAQKCHIIVPGKRERNYKAVRQISANDQIVEISKTNRPDYVSPEEWKNLPKSILMRRMTYTYPTKNGEEEAVLYTTLLDENIRDTAIIVKYAMRWDIEISIRETKTLMDINVLRSKSREMMIKELLIALTAYNMVRKKIAESADAVGFPPQDNIFQKFSPFDRPVLLDKRGRVFYKWSPGRLGYANGKNKLSSDSAPKREKKTLSAKIKKRDISKI